MENMITRRTRFPPWVGSALTAYAAGTGSWDDVVTAFVDGWAKEYKLANG